MIGSRHNFLLASFLAAATLSMAQTSDSDIPNKFNQPTTNQDFVKREVMIPMRDGVKLYTVIVLPKGAQERADSAHAHALQRIQARRAQQQPITCSRSLPQGDEVFVRDGYIRVFQDVRGKYKSEGDYVMTRPVRGPLNPTPTDHVTDAYDTIDWLVKNTPESNGRVGMIGSSYEGFTVVMALLDPHPALKVAAPESPMVDGWMGDDWFHYGAFRQTNFDYISEPDHRARAKASRCRATPTTITKLSCGPDRPALTPACTASINCRGTRR